jgi:hypothetical protein
MNMVQLSTEQQKMRQLELSLARSFISRTQQCSLEIPKVNQYPSRNHKQTLTQMETHVQSLYQYDTRVREELMKMKNTDLKNKTLLTHSNWTLWNHARISGRYI